MLPFCLSAAARPVNAAEKRVVEDITIDESHFPDPQWREKVREFDKNSDGILSQSERDAAQVFSFTDKGADSLKGLEYFTELRAFTCYGNNLTSLDVSQNTKLVELYCSGNKLTSLDLSHNPALKELGISKNSITTLDISHCPKLVELVTTETRKEKDGEIYYYEKTEPVWMSIYYDKTVQLIVDGNTPMATPTPVPEPDPSQNTSSSEQMITAIDQTSFPDSAFQAKVRSYDLNNDGNLSESEVRLVTRLDVSNSGITDLEGIRFFSDLESLICDGNQLQNLDVSNNEKLTYLSCGENPLLSLNVGGCLNLKTLTCSGCQLTHLDLSMCTALEKLVCSNNRLADLDIRNNTSLSELECEGNKIAELDIRSCSSLDALISRVDAKYDKEKGCYDFSGNSLYNHLRFDKETKLLSMNIARLPEEEVEDEEEPENDSRSKKNKKTADEEEKWALVNLIMLLMALATAVLTLVKKEKDEFFAVMLISRIASWCVVIAGGILFYLKEDLSRSMGSVDQYTPVFIVLLVMNILLFAFRFIREKNN